MTVEAVETDCVECGNALQIALRHGLHPVVTPGHNLHVALLDYRTCGGEKRMLQLADSHLETCSDFFVLFLAMVPLLVQTSLCLFRLLCDDQGPTRGCENKLSCSRPVPARLDQYDMYIIVLVFAKIARSTHSFLQASRHCHHTQSTPPTNFLPDLFILQLAYVGDKKAKELKTQGSHGCDRSQNKVSPALAQLDP